MRPNPLSIAIVFFAALAAGCLLFLARFRGAGQIAVDLAAARFVQARLVCISDTLILALVGYALLAAHRALTTAWTATVLAMMADYVGTLGTWRSFPRDVSGRMAKPQRMAAITSMAVACGPCLLVCALEAR